jgi:hypothetical protein
MSGEDYAGLVMAKTTHVGHNGGSNEQIEQPAPVSRDRH